MPKGPLAGTSVLVTRPEHQAQALVDEITLAGGDPIRFAAMEVVARPDDALHRSLDELNAADIIVFVSANAVRLGEAVLRQANNGCLVAAIGPATAAALEARGIDVDIRPDGGFDSESLLADSSLLSAAGKTVTIVRGDPGRELLADTLRARDARVQYLSAYSVRTREIGEDERRRIESRLASGSIYATVIMSIRTLDCLEEILSTEGFAEVGRGTLVAPGGRVIQTLKERLPGARCIRSSGTDSRSIVDALASSRQDEPDSR